MDLSTKLAALVFVGVWYVSVRTVIYHYFMGGGAKHGDMAFFDWWWSWGIAVPVTVASIAFGAILFLFLTL